MTRAKYLVVGLALAVLLLAGAGAAFAYGQMGSMMGGNGMDSMMGDQGTSGGQTDDGNGMGGMMGDGQMGSMMGGQGMSGGQMMGSFDEDQPFDLQFIDQMTMHHEGAIMSSQMMIADSKRPELQQLAENIKQSQSEQVEQMQEWREQWYSDAERTFGMMDPTRMEQMTGNGQVQGMMGSSSMQGMMGGDATDEMFLRMMIPHHQMAVDMSEQALDKAEHPELKELAQKIKDEQSAEIEQMQGYLEEIDPTNSNN